MKILLINPLIREWAKPNVLPLGLAYIASVLRSSGHEVDIMDINAHRWPPQEIERMIKEADYDVAGIGAIVTVYKAVKELIALLKKHHPSKPVIVGGSCGTSIPRIMIEKARADIVCIGEGEITVLDIVKAIDHGYSDDLADVAGIWYRDHTGGVVANLPRMPIKNMDDLPMPAWDLFPMDIYLKNPVGAPNRNKWMDGASPENIRTMNISGTRGCPYQCIYCYHDFMGQKYRQRSTRHLIEEIRTLKEKYDVKYVHLIDDEFCLNQKYVFDFCRVMKEEFNGSVTWACAGRVNLMTEELIKAMADAGCLTIGYGIESGSQKMLDAMKKGVTVEESEKAVALTQKYMGWADCSFMIGTPGETRQTIQETIDFCKRVDLTPEVIFFITPYPGTELYQMALDQGKIEDEEEYLLSLGEQGEKIRVNFTEFSDEELYGIQEEMIKELNAWNKIKHPEARA